MMQVYLGNLPAEATEPLLYELLRALAPVLRVRYIRSKAAAFADFATESDALYVLRAFNERPIELFGTRIHARRAARSTGTPSTGFKLHISNVNWGEGSVEDLRGVFEKFGVINQVELKHGGDVIVCFVNRNDAVKAREALNGQMVMSKQLRVEYARTANPNA